MPDDFNLNDSTVMGQLAQTEITVLGDTDNAADEYQAVDQVYGPVADIHSKYEYAKRVRLSNEQRWLNAWDNFRGNYNSRTIFRASGAAAGRVPLKLHLRVDSSLEGP